MIFLKDLLGGNFNQIKLLIGIFRKHYVTDIRRQQHEDQSLFSSPVIFPILGPPLWPIYLAPRRP